MAHMYVELVGKARDKGYLPVPLLACAAFLINLTGDCEVNEKTATMLLQITEASIALLGWLYNACCIE